MSQMRDRDACPVCKTTATVRTVYALRGTKNALLASVTCQACKVASPWMPTTWEAVQCWNGGVQ